MAGYALLGACIAGVYGIIHDQVTYTISFEYYTRVKFRQFTYADFGLPPRVFVGTIGFLATWWVGLFVGWFQARILVPTTVPARVKVHVWRGIAMVFATAVIGGVVGWLWAEWTLSAKDTIWLVDWEFHFGLEHPRAFYRVACIHNGGYLGALVGFILALVNAWRHRGEREEVGDVAATGSSAC